MILFLAGTDGLLHAGWRMLKMAGICLIIFYCVGTMIARNALKYRKAVAVLELGVGKRELVAMLCATVGIGLSCGALMFASELPEGDDWIFVISVTSMALFGGCLGWVASPRS